MRNADTSNVEALRNYFLGKDPQLKETMADNSLRLIGIPGRNFVLRTELIKAINKLTVELGNESKERKEEDERLQEEISDIEAVMITQEEAEALLSNYYTKAQVDDIISHIYTKSEVDTLLANIDSGDLVRFDTLNLTDKSSDYLDDYQDKLIYANSLTTFIADYKSQASIAGITLPEGNTIYYYDSTDQIWRSVNYHISEDIQLGTLKSTLEIWTSYFGVYDGNWNGCAYKIYEIPILASNRAIKNTTVDDENGLVSAKQVKDYASDSTVVHKIDILRQDDAETALDDYKNDLIYVKQILDNGITSDVNRIFYYAPNGLTERWVALTKEIAETQYPEYRATTPHYDYDMEYFDTTLEYDSSATASHGWHRKTEEIYKFFQPVRYIDTIAYNDLSNKLDNYQNRRIFVKYYKKYQSGGSVTVEVGAYFEYRGSDGWVECMTVPEKESNSTKNTTDYYNGKKKIYYSSSKWNYYDGSSYSQSVPPVFSVLNDSIGNMTSSNKNSLPTTEQVKNYVDGSIVTYSNFVGTDGISAGSAGLVPAPATTDAGKFLKADGTWENVSGGSGASDYETATAGATNGYYYISGSTAIAQREYRVYFPTNTLDVGAYLSVDGGTSYYPITWEDNNAVPMKAKFLSEKNIDLYFKNNRFLCKNGDTGWVAPTYTAGYTADSTTLLRRMGNTIYCSGQIKKDSGNLPTSTYTHLCNIAEMCFCPGSKQFVIGSCGTGSNRGKLDFFGSTNTYECYIALASMTGGQVVRTDFTCSAETDIQLTP